MEHNNLTQLNRQVAELRAMPAPSTQLIDALNAQAALLSVTDVPVAISVAKEAHALSRQLAYPLGAATSLVRLSWLHLQGGEFEASVVEAREALFLAERLNEYSLIVGATFVIASTQQQAGNYAKAEQHWLNLLKIARERGDRAREADYLSGLGILFQEQGDFSRTLQFKQSAHDIYVEIGDANHVLAKNNVAFALAKLGRSPEGLVWAGEALQTCNPDWRIWRAVILHTMGVVQLNLRQYAEARTAFTEALALSDAPSGRKQISAEVLLDVAKLELATNHVPAAFDALNRAVELAKDVKSAYLESEAHHALYRLHSLSNDASRATTQHGRYLDCRYELGCQRMEKQMLLIRAEAEAVNRQQLWMQARSA